MSMNKGDVTRVLSFMALYDKRTADEGDIRAWYGIIPGDVTVDDAMNGIKLYYQQNTKPMMPAQLIQFARAAKPERRAIDHSVETGPLLTIRDYGIERFIGEFNSVREAKGVRPLPPEIVKKIMKRNGIDAETGEIDEEIPF